MDTAIDEATISRKKRKTIFILLVIVAVLVAAVFLLRSSFASSLKKSNITTAVVEKGNIENTINATGEILPEFEEIITSPISASIQNVVADAGATVKTGQSVLTLDKAASQMEFEKQKFGLQSKQNDIQKLKLELDKSFYDIKSNNSIKQLRIS
ncbi:MAG: HlyD family efflux transporter periplasmic adaptor subunit, partial [Bacteroidota bacterium]